jgi:hypothetical protein
MNSKSENPDVPGTPSPEVLVAHLAGEAVLLNLADKRYYRLNESAAFIWKGLEQGSGREAILASIIKEFDVDTALASEQLGEVVADLKAKGLLR